MTFSPVLLHCKGLQDYRRVIQGSRKFFLPLVKDFFWKNDFPPMRALIFITGHVIYNPKFQLKTTLVSFSESLTYSHHDCLVLENWVDIIPHNFNYSNVPSLPTLIFYWIPLCNTIAFQASQAGQRSNQPFTLKCKWRVSPRKKGRWNGLKVGWD